MPEVDWRPPGCVVTGIALQVSHEVIAGFACCCTAVMTGGARSADTAVIKIRRYPGIGRVAGVALCTGLYVDRGLPGGCNSVVAAVAGTGRYTVMVKYRAGPAVSGVAVIAGITGADVVRGFTRCNGAVMASKAAARHIGMIHTSHR